MRDEAMTVAPVLILLARRINWWAVACGLLIVGGVTVWGFAIYGAVAVFGGR